jgi:hypothetical protein
MHNKRIGRDDLLKIEVRTLLLDMLRLLILMSIVGSNSSIGVLAL